MESPGALGRPARFWAGGFLYNPRQGAVFLHKRDDKARVNPNKWAFFGGLNEGEESGRECYQRELKEETGFEATDANTFPLCEYMNTELNTYRIVFFSKSEQTKGAFVLGEGEGFDWVPLDRLGEFDLTEKTRDDLERFQRALAEQRLPGLE